MKKNWKLITGITLLIEAVSFIVLFFMLYSKKKSLAATFLALGSIGGAAGAYLVLTEAKKEMQARERAALDTFSFDDDDDLEFAGCEFCCEDCSECDEMPEFGEDVFAEDAE